MQRACSPNKEILLRLQGLCTILPKMHGRDRFRLQFPCRMSFQKPSRCLKCNSHANCAGRSGGSGTRPSCGSSGTRPSCGSSGTWPSCGGLETAVEGRALRAGRGIVRYRLRASGLMQGTRASCSHDGTASAFRSHSHTHTKKRPERGAHTLKSGGELGIRTPDTLWGVYSLSRRAPSASRSALRRRRLTRLVILPLAARTCKKRNEVHNFAARLPAVCAPCEGDTPLAISRSAFAIGGSIF